MSETIERHTGWERYIKVTPVSVELKVSVSSSDALAPPSMTLLLNQALADLEEQARAQGWTVVPHTPRKGRAA